MAQMDEPKIKLKGAWTRGLTREEVEQFHSGRLVPDFNDPDLVYWWKTFDLLPVDEQDEAHD